MQEGAPKEPQGGEQGGCQEEPSSRRPRGGTPPATAQARADLPPRPPKDSRPGLRVKTSTTGPLTRGRAATAASSQGGGVGGVQASRSVVRGKQNQRLTLARGYRELRRMAMPRGQLVLPVGLGGRLPSPWVSFSKYHC